MRTRRADVGAGLSKRRAHALAAILALAAGWSVSEAAAADRAVLQLAQGPPAGGETGKPYTGNPTYAKQQDGREVWTYPDNSKITKDRSGKYEYRDAKGALERRYEESSNDFATYSTEEHWDSDGNWIVHNETKYRDGHFESLTFMHAQGPGGPIKESWSRTYNLNRPGAFVMFNADGSVMSSSPIPSLVDIETSRIAKLQAELKTIPPNAPNRAKREKELEDAQKNLSNYQAEIKKQEDAQNAPSQSPPMQSTPSETPPPGGVIVPGFGFGGFGFGFGGRPDDGPRDRGFGNRGERKP